MTSPPDVALAEIRRDFRNRMTSPDASNRARATTSTTTFLGLGKHRPHLGHIRPSCRQHAVLHAVQIATVDRWHESAGDETKNHARR